MGSVTVTLNGGTADEVKVDGEKLFNLNPVLVPKTVAPAVEKDTSFSTNWQQRIINLEGQSKVLYDKTYALETAHNNGKITLPQATLDAISAMKDEISKNKDSVNQNHLDMNEFIKTHPSDTEMEAKLRILNDLINDVKTSLSNAQKLINQNADKLALLDNTIIPSTYRMTYRVMVGTGDPTLDVTDNIMEYSKNEQLITLEETLSNEAADYEIVFNGKDTKSFYIPEYRNDQNPLRARLDYGGLSIQVHGEDAKFEIFSTTDDIKNIGYIEIRKLWSVVSK